MSGERCRLVKLSIKLPLNQCNKSVSVMGTTWSSSKNKACCPGLVIATFLILSSWLLDVMRTLSPGTFVSDILARFSGCIVNWLAWKTVQNLYQILNKIHLPSFTVTSLFERHHLTVLRTRCYLSSMLPPFVGELLRVEISRDSIGWVAEADRLIDYMTRYEWRQLAEIAIYPHL